MNQAVIRGHNPSLDKLEALIDSSIAAMTANGVVDDVAIAEAKGRALLALSKTGPQAKLASDPGELSEKVVALRQKLDQERALLQRRLDAAELVSNLVAEAVLAGEWDGTYEAYPTPRAAGARLRP